MNPIIIVGTGLAGYGTAREFRKHDKETPLVLITRDDGVSYYKPDLSEAHGKQSGADELVKKDAGEMAAELDATILVHRQVESIDTAARELTLNDETLAYHKLVLALGANPIVLNLEGDATAAIHKVNNLGDYRSFRSHVGDARHIGIFGAGLIGCEFANDLAGAGYDVSVFDPAGWPLSQLVPEACGRAVESELARTGVHWHLGHAAVGVRYANERLQITRDDDDSVCVDAVLSAVGLRADIEIAQGAGLKTGKGILVDRTLATSDPYVYALGDCAEVDGHWRPYVGPLMQCTRTLARTLATDDDDAPGEVQYRTLPIIVKTHVCPVIVHPPVESGGEWQIEGDSPNVEARCVDTKGKLLGFALTGEATGKRRDYLKEAPPLMA